METPQDLLDALAEARKMKAEVQRITRGMGGKDQALARHLNRKADETVYNLEMAIKCWEQMAEEDLEREP